MRLSKIQRFLCGYLKLYLNARTWLFKRSTDKQWYSRKRISSDLLLKNEAHLFKVDLRSFNKQNGSFCCLVRLIGTRRVVDRYNCDMISRARAQTLTMHVTAPRDTA